MNVSTAARRAGVLPRQIQKVIKSGALVATLITDPLPARWDITESDLQAWLTTRKGPGRPKQENEK